MVKGYGKELNNQRGSATIEAVIGFTAFLFAIFTILGLVNFCRAQMMVSSAVDTAAKEMSQYAYFYDMSGLQKFEEKVDGNSEQGKKNINSVIGTVDKLYGSINGAVEQTIEEKNNVEEMIAAGEVDFEKFKTSISNLSNDAESIKHGIDSVSAAIKDIGNDPLLYMRSVVAIIGSEGMEAAKRAIAVPLARAFVSRHFGESPEEVNATLESLGIEGGIDSMNFNLSNIFSDKKHQDIEINVMYKVKLFQVFDWVVLQADVSKVAYCRAWLGGDEVVENTATTEQPLLEEETSSTEEGETGDGETKEDESEVEDTEEQEGATEQEEESTPANTSTGNWALQHDPTGYYHSKRCEAFQDEFEEDYFIDRYTDHFYYHTSQGKAVGYEFDVCATWDEESYTTFAGEVVDPGVDLLRSGIEPNIKSITGPHKDYDGHVQEFGAFTYVVYVPENLPQDQYENLASDAETVKAEMEELIKNDTTGIPKDLKVNIVIVKSGGQYDYNSKESDYVHIGGEEG